jgi:hypothetical protein
MRSSLSSSSCDAAEAHDKMKVWFTRPSTWDLYVRGVERCHLWLQRPCFDHRARGRELDPILPQLPVGWRVIDPDHGDITGQVQVSVGDALPDGQYAAVLAHLWDALCRSVDGRGPLDGAPAPKRWEQGLDDCAFSDDDNESDVPPALWFTAALINGLEYQTAAGRWAQKAFPLDDELGVGA